MAKKKAPPAKNRQRTGGRFARGVSGNPSGRKKGAVNKVTRIAKDFCFGLVADPVYQANFQAAFQARKVDVALEQLVWHYAYGKPTQILDVTLNFDHAKYLAEKSPGQ